MFLNVYSIEKFVSSLFSNVCFVMVLFQIINAATYEVKVVLHKNENVNIKKI